MLLDVMMTRTGGDGENSFDRREAVIKYNARKFSEYFHDKQSTVLFTRNWRTVELTDLYGRYSSTEKIGVCVMSLHKKFMCALRLCVHAEIQQI